MIDIKSSWSLATFPIWPDEAATPPAMNGSCVHHMLLWDCELAELAYCMSNNAGTPAERENQDMHIVDHIPEHMRITKLAFVARCGAGNTDAGTDTAGAGVLCTS